MPVSASLWAASAAVRIASLNLCTDEYLLLAARHEQIASVSRLAVDRDDSPLWRIARGLHANSGQLEEVIGQRPTVLLTMGGGGRSTRQIASALRIKVVDLPYPQTIDDVATNLATVAAFTAQPDVAFRWRQRLARLKMSVPRARPAVFLGQGGLTVSPGSLTSQWMALAGLKQLSIAGGRLTAEQLLVRPPEVLLKSDYRHRQLSRGQQWLDQPWVRRNSAVTLVTDGRPWSCSGPLTLYEVERLRGLP